MKLLLSRGDGFVEGVPAVSAAAAVSGDVLRARLGLEPIARATEMVEEVEDGDVLDVLDIVRAEDAARALARTLAGRAR